MWNFIASACAALALASFAAGCGSSSSSTNSTASTATTTATTSTSTAPSSTATTSTTPKRSTKSPVQSFGKLRLQSPAFAAGAAVPVQYTCDGANISPPMQWSNVPHGTAELFLLAFDLTSETRSAVQWAVAGIPPSATGLSAGKLPAGAVVGADSAGKNAWGGLCAEKGHAQHVAFLLYALKQKLGVSNGFSTTLVLNHVHALKLASGLTIATYTRK
jgi:hypothetical protein